MIYGSPYYSVTDLSKMLTKLKVKHTIIGSELSQIKKSRNAQIVLIDSINRARYYKDLSCAIIVDAYSALKETNVKILPYLSEANMSKRLLSILKDKKIISLQIEKEPLASVIERVTTKSILTDVQTLVNKISPYSLRKKTHEAVIRYLYGDISKDKLYTHCNMDKLIPIYKILVSDQASSIRKAVEDYLTTRDEEISAEKFGVSTFEILYVYNSFEKVKA